METTNEEAKGKCPVCGDEVLKRGMFMHIFQSQDPDGEGHYPRFEVPPDIDIEEIKVTGTGDVRMDYPDTRESDDAMHLCTYTGKAYQGKRGLMIHLGQKAGQNNIPEDVVERHDAEEFPVVEVDDDGNVIEILREPASTVPSVKPYVPWYGGEEEYIPKDKVKDFVQKLRNGQTGAASADAIEKQLLK